MGNSESIKSHFSLSPLGAGDLIDRAVRFYRKNFWTFVLIASPPVIAGSLFFLVWEITGRILFSPASSSEVETAFFQLFIFFGKLCIWLIQTVITLIVMGGASRNFVRHLLYGEPITFAETYRSIKSRFIGLFGVSMFTTLALGFLGFALITVSWIALAVVMVIAGAAFGSSSTLIAILLVGCMFAIFSGALWLLFFVASKFVYIPQVMLVEGQDAFSAINRSMNLAGKNVRRVAMLFIFTLVATYLALAILYVPLGWYAWYAGVEILTFEAADTVPAWYEISKQVVSQVSFILLTPIWMIGLCLLYIDERVRKEGYDIELLAANRLGDIPSLPEPHRSPLHTALADQASPD